MTPDFSSDLSRKLALEFSLRQLPDSRALRDEYFALLRHLNRQAMGRFTINLPEYKHPIYCRAGSSDLDNYDQVIRHQEFGVDLGLAPRRIIDLGAFVGYATIFLANRYPEAEIVSLEPSPESFASLISNTAAYPQVTCLNGGAWSHTTKLVNQGHPLGDWGAQFDAADTQNGAGGIQAWSVDDILRMKGWPRVDMVKCDIEGSELEVFADPKAPWLSTVNCVTVELHDRYRPGCTETVAACFPTEDFDVSHSGELVIYTRRVPVSQRDEAQTVKLIDAAGPLHPMDTREVLEESWGLAIFDRHSLQLHPGHPGARPTRLVIRRTLNGQSVFSAGLLLASRRTQPVIFTATVRAADTGAVLMSGSQTAGPDSPATLTLEGQPFTGEVDVVLQTEMAPGTTSYFEAWAQWIHPEFRTTASSRAARMAAE